MVATFTSTIPISLSMDITTMPTSQPTIEPTFTIDPWECATKNISQYADLPKPTGALLEALRSYGDKLLQDCTPIVTGTVGPSCPFPEKSLWCGLTTDVPTAALPAYTSFGSVASSWWSAHSSAVATVIEKCPITWDQMWREIPGGDAWLKDVIVFGECYADANSTDASSTVGSSSTNLPSPISQTDSESQVSSTSQSAATVATTDEPNGVVGRTRNIEMWMVAGTGIAAAVMNAIW